VGGSSAQLDQFDDLYFVNDIHGNLTSLSSFLYNAKLVSKADPSGTWTGNRALIVFVGDYITVARTGHRCLGCAEPSSEKPRFRPSPGGNHEAGLLADPNNLSPRNRRELHQGDRASNEAAIPRPASCSLHAVRCRSEQWSAPGFVAHSGFPGPQLGRVGNLVDRLAKAWAARDFTTYRRG